ncbi:MAG: DUF4097 family beta strand repeat protein [Agathobacter sp.]|nr:DUF4097 family beta strand repeat protein [Agathobacter sp.]
MNIKKFTKIMLKIAGGVAIAGAFCMVVAFAMGLTTDGLKQMVKDGKFSFDMYDLENKIIIEISEDDSDKAKEDTGKEDTGVVLDESITVQMNGDERIYTTSESFGNMNIDFGAGLLDIHYDDVEEVEIHEKNIDGFEVDVKDNTLIVKNTLEVTLGDIDDMNNRSLVIVIPRDMALGEVDLDIGAAQADIDGISAKEVNITIGAGQANVSNISADNMEMEVGAGEATVSNLDATNLDVEAGLGQVTVEMCGAQTDYNYNVECGMGNVVVGDHSYGGVGAEHHGNNHHADKLIDIECGMGEVVVKFMQ